MVDIASFVMSLMNQSRGGARGGGEKESPDVKASRTLVINQATKARETGNTARLEELAPHLESLGIDPTIFGTPSPQAQAQFQFQQTAAAQMLELLNGSPFGPTAPQGTATPTYTEPAPTGIPALGDLTPPPSTEPQPVDRAHQRIFTEDFLVRFALKQFSGIDVGAHYLEAPEWFGSYKSRVDSGLSDHEALLETTGEFGFIPDGASNLAQTEPVKKALFEREFSRLFNDPELNDVLTQITPRDTNPQKFKAGVILDTLAQQGRFIPEYYQPLLDRYRGLEDPTFISSEVKERAFQFFGTRPGDLTPDIIASTRQKIEDENVIRIARETAAGTSARLAAEFELEASKPVSAEDRAKFGIGSNFPTYQTVADDGRRFPTEADRKVYGELHSMRRDMMDMQAVLFGTDRDPSSGIFTGIGNSMAARAGQRAKINAERIPGTLRSQNLELYNDLLAALARRLLTLAGESGGRFTDVDVQQISRSAPDPGSGLLGLPDAEVVARRKFERFTVQMGERLEKMLTTIVIEPIGQPAASIAPAPPAEQSDADIDELIKRALEGTP